MRSLLLLLILLAFGIALGYVAGHRPAAEEAPSSTHVETIHLPRCTHELQRKGYACW